MALRMTYAHIKKARAQPARLKNNPRVRVAQIVMDYQAHGWSAEEFCEHYPHLQPSEVHAALTYCYDHKEEIDSEIRSELDEVERLEAGGHTSPFYRRLK